MAKRRRKQADIEEAIEDTKPKRGHNSELNDAERRALTLHHKRLYEAADALVEKAKAERTAVSDLAKSDLGKGALADIKDLIVYGDETKAKANIERVLRLARWSGMPVGTTVDLFDVPVDDRAAEEGRTAGMAGEACNVPTHYPPTAHQRYIAAWHEGQGILASAFAKKRDQPSDTPNDTDVSEQPFAPPAADSERVRGGAEAVPA
jgi:hypothetical protein